MPIHTKNLANPVSFPLNVLNLSQPGELIGEYLRKIGPSWRKPGRAKCGSHHMKGFYRPCLVSHPCEYFVDKLGTPHLDHGDAPPIDHAGSDTATHRNRWPQYLNSS